MKKKGNEKIGKEREKSIAERFAEELVEEIKEDFKERQQARRPYELSWQLNMNFLAGNQYCSVAGDSLVEDEKTFEWQEKQVFNHIAPVYETRLAKLSRVRPKMTVRPFTDEDKDVNSAKLAKKILESCSEKLSVNGIMRRRIGQRGASFRDLSRQQRVRRFGRVQEHYSRKGLFFGGGQGDLGRGR